MANEELKISKDKFVPAIMDATISEAINKPSLNFWQDAWLRIRKNKAALVSMVVMALVIIFAFVGPSISGYGMNEQDLNRTQFASENSCC